MTSDWKLRLGPALMRHGEWIAVLFVCMGKERGSYNQDEREGGGSGCQGVFLLRPSTMSDHHHDVQ